MNCFICFSEIEDNSIKCNSHCSINLCHDCFDLSLEYSNNNKLLPTCQNNNCNSEYFYSNIKNTSHVNQYLDNLIDHLNDDNKDTVSKLLIKDKMYETIRNQRKQFVNQFPQGVNLIIELALSSRIKKINKTNQLLADQNKITRKSCFNILCKGALDNKYHCYLCDTQYCEICEMKKDKNHKCKKIDLDSIKMINSIIKCPQCKIPIEKSEGCNEMRCSSCQTNFNYRTGEISGSGNNHNEKINIKNSTELLSDRLQNLYDSDIINKIIEIENLKISDNVSKDIINILKNNNFDDNIKISLAKKYEKMQINKQKSILYYKSIIMIEDLHSNNKLNLNILNQIYNKIIS